MFRSLRSTLILPWHFVAVVCCALTFQLRGLFELGIGGKIGKVRDSVKNSAEQIKQKFSLYLTGFSEAPADFGDFDRHRELLLLLDLVLGRFHGIEGGFWSPNSQFIAYSIPTHDTVKRDVPKDDSDRIETLNKRVRSTQNEETARFDSAGEVLLIHAIPVRSDLVVWTMGRVHVTAGFVVLLLLMLAAGALNLWCLHRWGQQLLQIEERLLAIVRLDRLTLKSTKIGPWPEECVAPFRNIPGNAAMDVEAAETDWLFDEQQLSRELHNLVANAVQHTPPNGWVKITASIENEQLEIVVQDSGSGVPEELKEKIFEPFVSSPSTGSGLGLAIACEIVEAHGGTLQCVNGRIGARFEIRLPRREPCHPSS